MGEMGQLGTLGEMVKLGQLGQLGKFGKLGKFYKFRNFMNTWSQAEELHEISANHLYECKPVKNEAVMIPLGTVAAAWECCECSLPSYLLFYTTLFY